MSPARRDTPHKMDERGSVLISRQVHIHLHRNVISSLHHTGIDPNRLSPSYFRTVLPSLNCTTWYVSLSLHPPLSTVKPYRSPLHVRWWLFSYVEAMLMGQVSTDFDDDPNVMAARNAAGTGIGSNCQIPRMGTRGSIGDIGASSSPFSAKGSP